MNTEEINRQLNSIDCFVGTFSRDKLPDVNKYPAAVVINTDVSSRPGEHWVAVYFNSERQAEYFDSYGFPPLHIDIKRFIEKNSIGWCYNTVLLQAIDYYLWEILCSIHHFAFFRNALLPIYFTIYK